MTKLAKVIGGKIPPKEHRKLNIEDELDYIFERLVFAKMSHVVKNVRKDCMFMPDDMGPMWAHFPSEKDDIIFNSPSAVNSPDLVWPMSVGTVSRKRNSKDWGSIIECNYWQNIDAKHLRGNHRFVGRKNVAWYTGVLEEKNKNWTPARMFAAWHLGGWRTIQRVQYDQSFLSAVPDAGTGRLENVVATGEQDIGRAVAVGQSIALTYRYEWGAQFSIGKSSRIIIPTTPKGVLELFNDRDKPVDRDRRAALRHWVSQHRRRKQSGSFTGVREHLRGQTSFNWRGFDVKIVPSKFDIEKSSK